MARGPGKKNPFDALDPEFKSTIENMSEAEIRAKISEVAILEHKNKMAQKEDQDLAEKKAIAAQANEQYAEATKAHKLQVAYGYFMLSARGKE